MSQTLLLDRANGVAILTLNRPRIYNAVSVSMLQELLAALDEIEANDSLQAVLMTGAGRAFSSGGDLAGPLDPDASIRVRDELPSWLSRCGEPSARLSKVS